MAILFHAHSTSLRAVKGDGIQNTILLSCTKMMFLQNRGVFLQISNCIVHNSR